MQALKGGSNMAVMKSLADMTLTEKLGQMIVTGLPGPELDGEFVRLVREEKIGNVILFQYNQRDREQLSKLCADLRELILEETGTPPLISSDEEGGIVSRLPESMGKMPSAMAMASLEDPQAVYNAALWTGRQLRSVGINFVLAPVLDINNNLDNPVIGVRSFGRDADTVCALGREALRGFRDAGIMCVGKHFPGHGDTATDPHLDFALVTKGREELRALELVPFRMAMEEDVPAIMVAHVAFAGEDGLPSTLSPQIITGLLREELGYRGLVVSDCMEMDAIRANFGVAQGVLRSVKAGMDQVGISRSPHEVRAALKALREAVEDGSLPMERIDSAVERILACKARYAGPPIPWSGADQARCNALADSLFTRAVDRGVLPQGGTLALGDRPRFLSPIRQQLSLVTDKESRLSLAEELAAQFGGEARDLPLRPDEAQRAELLRWAAEGTSIVAGSLNAAIYREQMELLQSLAGLGLPMACAALRSPFELDRLPEAVLRIPLYEYSPRAVRQVCRFLKGAGGCPA